MTNPPWILRICEKKGCPPPVMIVRERRAGRETYRDRGRIAGDAQRRVLPILRAVLSRVCDGLQVPLDLHRHLPAGRITFRGDMPLDDEAGFKLSLIFKLAERVGEMGRVELIARRVERFTREEAGYWLSRLHDCGPDARRFAAAGLRLMLGGRAKDAGVGRMLEDLRGRL